MASDLVNQFLGNLPSKIFSKQIRGKHPGQHQHHDPDRTEPAGVGGSNISLNSQTIATRAAVQIIDVLPNGNLVFEGIRQVSFSKERQFCVGSSDLTTSSRITR